MRFSSILSLSAYLLLLLGSKTAAAQNPEWNRFRGAGGAGIDCSHEAPVSWDSADFRWNIALPGTGNASPVVWENMIFVTCSDDERDTGYVIAVDEKDGNILWQKEFHVSDLAMHVDNNLASSSPAVDESHVYVAWYSRKKTSVIALDHEGNLQWNTEFDGIEARHGGGSSLMLTDAYVIFTREQEAGSSFKSSWVAVDKQTGQTAWELERESAEGNSFSTPILIESALQKAQLIFTSQAHGFTGIDPESGHIIWERKGLLPHRVVASPVYADGFIVGCRKGEGVVLEFDPETNHVGDTAFYYLPRHISPYVPTPIIVDGLLFLFTDGGFVACLRLSTGELLWKERPAGPIYGSPICVDGTLFCQTKQGQVIIIPAESTFHLMGIIELGDGSSATPAICSQGMVLRTFRRLMLL